MSNDTNDGWAREALDELTAAGWQLPTEFEALVRAAREGDLEAGWDADRIALAAEMEPQ